MTNILRALKDEDWPEKTHCEPYVVLFPNGVMSGNCLSRPNEGTREYTRTDRANELVAAAYEAAASEVDANAAYWSENCNDAERIIWESEAAKIRSLTPADAVAALAARDARIREAALREAYVNLKTYRPHEVDGPEHDVGYTAGYVTAMNRVESLIAKDKANG